MATTSGGTSSKADSNGNGPDPKLEVLMEKIRAKPNQKSWPEIIKNLRMAISDKRHFSEVNDKQLLQKYLDILQKAIKVNGHMSLLEKLSSLARGVGLKYTSSAPYSECFLSTDMFYVEMKVDTGSGRVQEVTVVHDAGEYRSPCPEVADIINQGKFDEFTDHLEGLMSIYKINGDKKQKSRCFMALQSLEKDLNLLAQLQSSVNGVSLYIHKTPLGIVQPRIGGLPMKLIFFVAPIDLVKKGKIRVAMTVESIIEKRLGHSSTIGIEPSSGHKLQTVPLMSVNKNSEGKSLPSFTALSNQNSCLLPAWFTLSLIKPLPVSMATVRRIQSATGIEFGDLTDCKPILELIVKDVGHDDVTYKPNMPFFVSLPNQEHCYYVTGSESADHMMGTIMTSVPFVHPTHVPQILQALRQQIAFNTLVGMLVRPKSKTELDNCMIFEMNLVSLTQISVLFEHPITDMMASVEFEFSDLNNVRAQFMSPGGEDVVLTPDENLCKIVNKTYSVPITMRSLMKRASEILTATQAPTPATPAEQALTPLPLNSDLSTMSAMSTDQLLQADDMTPLPSYSHQHYQDPGSLTNQNGAGIYDFDPYNIEPPRKVEVLDSIRAENVAKNPMLASLLDQDSESSEVQPVLPTLLSDPLDPKQKQRKHRKRKAEARSPGSSSGRSPKRKYSEDDHFRSQEGSFDMDSNDGFDLGQQVPFPSGVTVPSSISQSQTGGGNISNPPVVRHQDSTHVARLKSSLESLIKQQQQQQQQQEVNRPRGELVALLADEDEDPPAKIPAIGQPATRRMTSRDEAPPGEEVMYHVPDVTLDPEIFTTDDGTFTPTDFIGSAGKEPRSAGFQTDGLEFNPDLLTSDTFPDTMTENSEEMDLDACDANAFGIGMNKAVAKLVTPPKPDSSKFSTTSSKSSKVAPSGASLASQVPLPIPSGPPPTINITEKRESKKEKSDYRPMKKSNKPLSARIGEPKPDLDALDFTALPIKESKATSLKSLLKETCKEKRDKEDGDGDFFTSTATGGTSIVISAKSSPSSTSKESLKISVKKDRIKKSSKEEDLKRKKTSSFSKEKTFKKRRIDDESRSKSDSKSGEIKPIKIRTSGGKVEIQSHGSSSKSKMDSKPDLTKVGGPDYLKHIFPKLTSKLPRIPRLSEQGKPNLLDKSTINPQGSQKVKKAPTTPTSTSTSTSTGTGTGTGTSNTTSASITVSKSDSKLMTGKTPTIKLKPLVMPPSCSSSSPPPPGGVSVNKPVTSSTKTQTSTSPSSSKTGSITSPSRVPSSMSGTPPPLPVRDATPPVGSGTPPHGASSFFNSGKGKSPVKARSLSDVINKLKAKSGGPSSGGEEEVDDKEEKKKEEKKIDKEKKIIKEKSSSASSSSTKKPEKNEESKVKVKPEMKKSLSTSSVKSSVSKSSSTSLKSGISAEKKSEMKKSSSSPVSKAPPGDKRSPSPSIKSERKEKLTKEEASSKDPRLEPKPDKPRPPEPKADKPRPQEPKADKPRPLEPKLDKPRPLEPKPDKPRPLEPKPDKPRPLEPKLEKPRPVEPKPDKPRPLEPKPDKPRPQEPKADKPRPQDPKADKPRPLEPKPDKPRPVEPKLEKPRPSSAENFRPPTQETPKIRDSPKLDDSSKSTPGKVSPLKESPDSPDESLVMDLPLTPSSGGTRTIPMERSSPSSARSSPIPQSPLSKGQVSTLVKTASPLVRASSPLVRAPSPVRTLSPVIKSTVPASSPVSGLSKSLPVTSPVSNPSPCPIDDDLMNEAVMTCEDK